ncbi:N-terminal kinase-like protein [Babesia sp. Xinjiang]|uniref:N-terminal kinase-like protein n=1 Tax=Babesia sp. Xinjiang TaxID=462227 RepID=UPI000A265CD6|nr:N-terminal kinase-like protein [Babesia sp. Xinjiang]ORM42005.1 N-terminal kinase-like protein [Babesia sp. Xinjiang]
MLKYLAGKSPISFTSSGIGYTEGEPVESPFGRLQSYAWYNSTAKGKDTPASLFKFSSKHCEHTGNKTDQEFAERHMRCIKLIVHPNVLKVLKIKQSDTGITIATERCYPLSTSTISADPSLGFAQIISALHFLHTKCNKSHCLISPIGVVVREDGSWCLTSFECTVEHDTSIHRVLSELKWHASWNNGWRIPISATELKDVRQLDQWGLGALMCWVYTLISGQMDIFSLRRHDCDIQSLKRYAPANLRGLIDQLMSPDHDINLEEVLKTHPYFSKNEGIVAMSFAMEFHIKTEEQMKQFFSQLPSKLPLIPTDIACKQLLPEALKVISLHKALVPQILVSVVAICKSLLKDEFKTKVYPHILRLFQENDRAIRYSLLKLMPDLDPLLDDNEVSNNLLEPLLVGLGDAASQIRDETVKGMVYVMKKIKRRQQNNAAMLLFKCVEDCEPTIRVNTIICFAKIIPFIHQELVDRVVPQVWRIGLSDTFLKSRMAALESISASHDFFGIKEKVGILLPLACNTLLDTELQVRRLGMETIYSILESLRGQVQGVEPHATTTSGRRTRENGQAGIQGVGHVKCTTPTTQSLIQPMTLGAASVPSNVYTANSAFYGTSPQQVSSERLPWGPDQGRQQSTHIATTEHQQLLQESVEDFEDFFDPFPVKN